MSLFEISADAEVKPLKFLHSRHHTEAPSVLGAMRMRAKIYRTFFHNFLGAINPVTRVSNGCAEGRFDKPRSVLPPAQVH